MSANRLAKFRSFKDHGWLKRIYKKLSAKDLELAEQFILEKDSLDQNEFEMAVNRMFLDQPSKPPKWTLICELLANSNVSSST